MGRIRILQIVVVAVFAVLASRLFYIQVLDSRYKSEARNNVLRREVQYPPRGEVYDRNGEFLVRSRESYDLMVVPRDMKPFDTLLMSRVLGVAPEKIKRNIARATAYSRRRPSVVLPMLSKEEKSRLDECDFPGFYTVFRTVRSYPRKIGGNLLGSVGEVSPRVIERDSYYKSGDYIGESGVELAYEEALRGVKGVKVNVVDVHGITKGSYNGGEFDTVPVPGSAIVSTIDAELQAFGEELLAGKVGSIVAIEPSTGEILVMVSSPTYDPDELVGRERGNHYMELLGNPRRPMFNRAVMAKYPPGSTFKLVNGLIGMQEGVVRPETTYPCHNGYTVGRGVKCHSHASPLNLIDAVKTSCNAYFCYVFRNIIDNPKYGSVKRGFDVWNEYVRSFGFGRKLDSDFIGELNGNVPTSEFYDKRYNGRWNSLTTVSLSIGQGELGCTPLQMANLAAIVANRGYYYIPHVVRSVEGRDSLDMRFYQKHYTKVDTKYFEPVVEGMWRAVHRDGTARVAYVEGLDICGKTGTAQNPHGRDHSTFLSFAPRNNPRIAVSVYVEHGIWGATVAAPVASLIIEKYLTGEVSRPELVEQVKQLNLNYSYYDRQQK